MPAKRVFIAHNKADLPPTAEIGQQAFGRRLQQLLDQKGWNYSDLARAVWGKTTTASGYEVAKNRDRISVYVAGKAVPDPRNLKKIADAFGVEVADIAPERVGNSMIEQPNPAYSITKVQGETDKVFLRVNKIVPEASRGENHVLAGDQLRRADRERDGPNTRRRRQDGPNDRCP